MGGESSAEKESRRIRLQEAENVARRLEFERQERERQRRIEQENKRRDEKINYFRENQDISEFLRLIKEFTEIGEFEYVKKTLEALNENKIIEKYKHLEKASESNLQIINETIQTNKNISTDCLRKLAIILLCYEKNRNKCDDVLKKFEKKSLKDLIFNVFLDYSKTFGNDIQFENKNVYKEFVDYSIKNGKYLESLDYLYGDRIQLEILNEKKEDIFKTGTIVNFFKLDSYDDAYNVIQDLIEYEKEKNKKFILFKKDFWENYYLYYENNQNQNNIEKLVYYYLIQN